MSRRAKLGAVAALLAMAAGADQPGRPKFVLQDRIVRAEPFAESRLQINPPTFRWPAQTGVAAYRIDLSRDPDFRTVRTQVVTDLFYRPLEPLAEGTWHWRYRAEGAGAGAWLGTEQFTIGPEMPRWAVPDWAQLVARIPAGHPRVYLREEEVEGFRARARTRGAGLERWKEKVLRAAERPYSLKTYQARVPAVGPGVTAHQAKKELIWAAKAAGSDAGDAVGDLAWVWLATGDARVLAEAKRRTLLAAALDPAGFVSERNSDFGNAALVMNLGVAYDLLYGAFTEAERATIRQVIVARAKPIFAVMARASQQLMKAHNWQHVFLDGLTGALAVYGEAPEARPWVELGLKSFVALYPWFGGNDGGSQEGTRYYLATEMIASLCVREVFQSAFGLDLARGNPWFRANANYLMYAFPPGSLKAKLADSNPGAADEVDDSQFPNGRVHLAADRMAHLDGNGFAAAYAARVPNDGAGYGVAEYLRWAGGPEVKPEPLEKLPAARLFRDIGVVFTHSDYMHPEENVRLVFHSGPYGATGHAHADQNSFHVIAYNEDLLLDSGYYTPVGDPHREEWSIQTKAHNTLLVDGAGQPYGSTSSYGQITGFEARPEWVSITGSAATAYEEGRLERFDRHIVWLKGGLVQTYVVVDELEAAGPRRFDWLLHAARRMQVDAARQRVTVKGGKGEAAVTWLAPRALSFAQDDRFDVPATYWRKGKNFPLPNQWHLKATAAPAAQTRFVAVIQVRKAGSAATGATWPPVRALADGVEAGGFRVELREGEHRLRVRRLESGGKR